MLPPKMYVTLFLIFISFPITSNSFVGELLPRVPLQRAHFGPNDIRYKETGFPNDLSLEESSILEKEALNWIDSHQPEGLVLRIRDNISGFRGGPDLFHYNNRRDGLRATLVFSKPVTTSDTVKDVRAKFQAIALDKLPVKDLHFPDRWEVTAQTPVSSFRRGVKITSFDGRHIGLRVRTRLFAISGKRKDVSLGADQPSPPGSYFQARENFPLDLTLETPITIY